jgi:hypothetical protein
MASKQSGPGCLVLFGLVFILVGSIPGCIALRDLHGARATRSWIETPATLLDVQMRHGEDTDAVEARYRYRAPDRDALEGGALRDYEGSQVGIHGGSDNVGDWQRDTFARLERAWKSEQTVPCWYDPADPAQAVLDRTERWELIGFLFIFPLVFGLAGGGIAWFGFIQWRKARRPAPDPQVVARQTLIRADVGRGCGLWIMTVIWNALSWVAAIVAFGKGEVPTLILLLVALFPLIGIGMLYAALQATLRSLRHGRPQLRLEGGSWTTGTRVQATVLSSTTPQPGDRIEACLKVIRRVTTGSGDDSSTTDQSLWSLDLVVDALAGFDQGGTWACAVELPLPGDLPATANDVTWRLDWHLVRPGPDLSASFILPVVAGVDDGSLKAIDLAMEVDRGAPLAVLLKVGVRISDDGGLVVIGLPAWRNPALHLTGLVSCLLLSLGGMALWQEVGWWTGLLSLPILGLSWRGALRSAMWRSRITLSRDRVLVSAGWWRMESHDLRTADILEVERTSSMSSGETAWHNMWLQTAEGQRIAIVRGVPGPASARIAEMIESVRR